MALRPQDPENEKEAPRNDKAASEQDVFRREVDEALREDELKSFFSRFGIPLLVIVVLGLAALGGYLWWDSSRQQAADERGEQFIVALDELEARNLDAADEKLAPIAEAGSGGSSAAAKLLRAGIAIEDKRPEDALAIYREVAGDEDAPQVYRDLATVREVAASFDDMEPQAVVDRLKPLAVPGNPWFGVSGELVGMAYLKQDKEDLAGPLFAKIARDEDLPQSIRGRARQLAGMLGVDAIDDVIGGDEDDASETDAAEEDGAGAEAIDDNEE